MRNVNSAIIWIVLCGLLGYAIGQEVGALIGGFIGYLIGDRLR